MTNALRLLPPALLLALSACQTPARDVPYLDDGVPRIRAGFYTVHEIRYGAVQRVCAATPFGKILHLYSLDYVETDWTDTAVRRFAGLRGCFLPDGLIGSVLEDGAVRHVWEDADGGSGELVIPPKTGPDDDVIPLRVWTDDNEGFHDIALKYHAPRIALDRIPTVYLAHRGSCYFNPPPYNLDGIYPANTIPAFQASVDMGYEGFELDVHVTQDGHFVVSHDESLDVATDGKGKVRDRTLASLRGLTVRSSALMPEVSLSAVKAYLTAPLPGLREVLDRFLPEPRVTFIAIDIKPDSDERIVAAARKALENVPVHLLGKLIFISASRDVLAGLKARFPQAHAALDGSTGTEPFSDYETFMPETAGKPPGPHDAVSANFGLYLVPPTTNVPSAREFLRTAAVHRYGVVAWTINDVMQLNQMVMGGIHPDVLLSDAPYHRIAHLQLKVFDETGLPGP